jgi:hypothetical protein
VVSHIGIKIPTLRIIRRLVGEWLVSRSKASLGVHIASLRRVLREHSTAQSYIQTVYRYGYRFIGEVSSYEDPNALHRADLEGSLLSVQENFTDRGLTDLDSAEAMLTLAGGLRIEAWKSSFGTKITVVVPEPRVANRVDGVSARQTSQTDEVVVTTLNRDGMRYITVALDYELS